MEKKTKATYMVMLNRLGVPEHDKKSNGGRVSDTGRYGSWLRRYDPTAFEVGYREWER